MSSSKCAPHDEGSLWPIAHKYILNQPTSHLKNELKSLFFFSEEKIILNLDGDDANDFSL